MGGTTISLYAGRSDNVANLIHSVTIGAGITVDARVNRFITFDFAPSDVALFGDLDVDTTYSIILTTTSGSTDFRVARSIVDVLTATDADGYFKNAFRDTDDLAFSIGGQFIALAAAVPEPSSVALLTLGGLALVTRRKRA